MKMQVHRVHHLPFHLIIYSRVRNFFRRERSFMGHQRQIVLLCATAVALVSWQPNQMDFSQAPEMFFTYLNCGYGLSILLTLLAYLFLNIKVKTALTLVCAFGQLACMSDMIYCSFDPTYYDRILLLIDMLMAGLNILFAVMGYLEMHTLCLSAITLISYTFSVYNSGDSYLYYSLPAVMVFLSCICGMTHWLVKNTEKINKENFKLKRQEGRIRKIIRLDIGQMEAYLALAKQKLSEEETSHMLRRLDFKTQQCLIGNLKAYFLDQATAKNIIAERFPELTPSELEICQLILQGRKLNEICSILKKTETNVSSQRAHIRKKMGLKPEENLFEALKQRMRPPQWREAETLRR